MVRMICFGIVYDVVPENDTFEFGNQLDAVQHQLCSGNRSVFFLARIASSVGREFVTSVVRSVQTEAEGM